MSESYQHSVPLWREVLAAIGGGRRDYTEEPCHWCLKLSLAYGLSAVLGWGPAGVFVAVPVTEVVVASTALLLFRRGRWKHRQV